MVYDGIVAGDFVADMLIADAVLGLLLNFRASSLQVKRKHRTYRAKGMSNPVNPVNPV
ncbi:MAG: hypothetical protein ABSG91_02535 [Syntrophobacteraceae bacterium]